MENELKRDFFRKFRKDVEEVKLTSNSNKLISVLNREFLGVKFYIKGIRFELVQNNKYYDEYGIYLSMGYEFDDKSCKFLKKCTTQTQRDMFADLKYDVNSGVFMGILSLTYMHNIKDFNYLVSPKDGSELYILYYPNDENWEIISSQKNQERIIKMQQKIQKKLKKTRR